MAAVSAVRCGPGLGAKGHGRDGQALAVATESLAMAAEVVAMAAVVDLQFFRNNTRLCPCIYAGNSWSLSQCRIYSRHCYNWCPS